MLKMKKISVDNMIVVLKSKYNLDFSKLDWKSIKIEAQEKYKLGTATSNNNFVNDSYALDIVADIKELMLEKIERNRFRTEERVFFIDTLLEEFFSITGFPKVVAT